LSKKLKMPEKGLFGLPSSVRQTKNEKNTSTQVPETTTKAESDNDQEKEITAKRLEVNDILPQNVQEVERFDAKEVIHQSTQAPKLLDAIPQNVETPSHLEVEPQNSEPPERQVDKTLKSLSDKTTKPLDAEPLDGETPKKKKAKSLVKKTYYIDHDLDGAIELMAVLQRGDQSDIVRKLLRSAIPEYYLTQWKVMSDHSK